MTVAQGIVALGVIGIIAMAAYYIGKARGSYADGVADGIASQSDKPGRHHNDIVLGRDQAVREELAAIEKRARESGQ